MQYVLFIVWLFFSGAVFALEPAWNLLWAGSWEESKTLLNRGELRLDFPLPDLTLRAQILDKRPLNPALGPPWTDSAKAASGFSSALYHKSTGSRLLYGIVDEWGLSARIRSPWIRSAPYAENHRPLITDLKTAISSTKEPEVYLYLSSPQLAFFPDSIFPETLLRTFASAQIHTEGESGPAFAGGLEAMFGRNIELLVEGFFTGAELPARKSNTWFSDPPALPARDFRLGAVGLLLHTPALIVSSDWAWSETFAWDRDVYGNLGIRYNPLLPAAPGKAPKKGPWSVSLAVDGSGERYIGRDGSSPGAGFRGAGKVEWKGTRSSLLRIGTSLRASGIGEDFTRSSTGLYYRFPAPSANDPAFRSGTIPLRVTRISLSMDRNESNPAKILDGMDGTLGLSLNLPIYGGRPLGITISGAVKRLNSSFDSAKGNCEFSWLPGMFQFRTKCGYAVSAQKEGQWETAFSTALRCKRGRLSIKAASDDFPHKWNGTISWRLEQK